MGSAEGTNVGNYRKAKGEIMGKRKLDFIEGLGQIKQSKRREGSGSLDITAGELHHYVGDYPPPPNGHHAMATASDVLRDAALKSGGEIIYSPPKGKGAKLRVLIRL
jgi:hypothetical protein